MTKLLRNRRLNFHAAGGAGEAVSLLSFSKITNVRGQKTDYEYKLHYGCHSSIKTFKLI